MKNNKNLNVLYENAILRLKKNQVKNEFYFKNGVKYPIDEYYYLDIIRDQQKEIRLLNSKINDLNWFNSEIINSKNELKNKLNEGVK